MKRFLLMLPLAVLMSLALPAGAVLGEAAQSVQKDQAHMRGTLRVQRSQAYTLHEIRAPYGTVVREYVSPSSGNVFAITWKGPKIPDLRQLLGHYFDQYARAAQSRRGHGPLIIELPGLVVQSAGHQRSFSGRAWLPQEMPQGTRAEKLP
ncbi:MAG TPA: DUF2844 domain-containing protein [Terriglobales bacterium]|nr:DUF2844 domain-containing protein [Terriglobales bacterium]